MVFVCCVFANYSAFAQHNEKYYFFLADRLYSANLADSGRVKNIEIARELPFSEHRDPIVDQDYFWLQIAANSSYKYQKDSVLNLILNLDDSFQLELILFSESKLNDTEKFKSYKEVTAEEASLFLDDLKELALNRNLTNTFSFLIYSLFVYRNELLKHGIKPDVGYEDLVEYWKRKLK